MLQTYGQVRRSTERRPGSCGARHLKYKRTFDIGAVVGINGETNEVAKKSKKCHCKANKGIDSVHRAKQKRRFQTIINHIHLQG